MRMGAKTRCNIFFHWPIIYEAQKIPWTDLGMCTKIGLWPIPIFRFRSKIAPWEMNGLFHNFASEYSRDLVLMSNSRFMRIRHLGHFQKPQIVMWAKNRVEGLYEAKDNFKGWHWNLGIEQATNLVLASNPMFFDMWNHLGPFSWYSDQPEGQEEGVLGVGCQGRLQGVGFYICFWT